MVKPYGQAEITLKMVIKNKNITSLDLKQVLPLPPPNPQKD